MSKLLDQISSSPLIFGGASISGEGKGYGFGSITENESIDLLNYALDQGVNVFDSAPIYGFGTSEQRIGKAFKNCRENVHIISKSGVSWHDNMRVNTTNDPGVAKKMLEDSLRRLDTDYIDLYMIHWPDSKVDIRKPMDVLAKAKLNGKIKHIGLCNTYDEDLSKALEIDKIEAVQNQLNVFDTGGLDCVQNSLKSDISFMSWGTFDKGIITGSVTKDRKFERDDARSWAPWWKQSNYKEKVEKMEKVLPFLESIGFNGADFAISFNLSFDNVSNILCGTRNQKQLDSVLSSIKNQMPEDQLNEALSILNED